MDTGEASLVQREVSADQVDGGIVPTGRNSEQFWWLCTLQRSPSQKSKIFASPLYTRGPLAAGRPYLRVDTLREEQRAMPAYEEPPVLPGGSYFLCLTGKSLLLECFAVLKYRFFFMEFSDDRRNTVCISRSAAGAMEEKMFSKPCKSLCESA